MSDQAKNQIERSRANTLRSLIMKQTEMLKMALPKTITPERMARIAMTAVTKTPSLASCTTGSFFGALLTAAQLGLEVNTPLGQAYLIPYNSKRSLQCQFQIGYRGLLELAYRSGKYKRIQARVVYSGDDFVYSYGLNAVLQHKPIGRGEPTHVYALYELVNGGGDFEVWTWEQVMQHGKTYSKSFNDGPWQTAPEEMAKKTVLISLLKYAPKSVELAEAVTSDGGTITKDIARNDNDIAIITDIDYDILKPANEELLAKSTPTPSKDVAETKKEPVQKTQNAKTFPVKSAPEAEKDSPSFSQEEEDKLTELWEQSEMDDIMPSFPM